jgi:hypothetical protein
LSVAGVKLEESIDYEVTYASLGERLRDVSGRSR